jgi:hypothetical protein
VARLKRTVDNPPNSPVSLLQHQDVTGTDEGHGGRLVQAASYLSQIKIRITERLRESGTIIAHYDNDNNACYVGPC